jgi:hypothetical protein
MNKKMARRVIFLFIFPEGLDENRRFDRTTKRVKIQNLFWIF